MDIKKTFGMNLKKYRRELGCSQERFAELCGLHRTYISDIECFQRNVSLENIQRIADALGVEGRPSRLLKPPGNLPAAYIFSS